MGDFIHPLILHWLGLLLGSPHLSSLPCAQRNAGSHQVPMDFLQVTLDRVSQGDVSGPLTPLPNKPERHGSGEGTKVCGTEEKRNWERDGLRCEISRSLLLLGLQREGSQTSMSPLSSQSTLPARKHGSVSVLDSDQPNQQRPL